MSAGTIESQVAGHERTIKKPDVTLKQDGDSPKIHSWVHRRIGLQNIRRGGRAVEIRIAPNGRNQRKANVTPDKR